MSHFVSKSQYFPVIEIVFLAIKFCGILDVLKK